MISSPQISTTILYNFSSRCSRYLNWCVVALASKVVEAFGGSVPFSLKPNLIDLEGGC